MSRLSRDELHELQSAETWEDVGETIQPAAKAPRAVVSVAFSREDFESIVELARKSGMKTSEFIRSAAMDKATPKPREETIIAVSGGVQTSYVSISPPRAKTEVTTRPEPSIYATA